MEGNSRKTTALVKLHLLCLVAICSAIETPEYTVVHVESDFEVRLYGKSTWMSAPARDLSFKKATLNGFHRLFQFIEGANLNYSRIPMTFPIVTSIVPEAGPLHSSAYSVLFYLPAKFQETPPSPLPELSLKPYRWTSHCIAISKFSGFAKDDNIVQEAEKLAFSLSRSTWVNSTSPKSDYAYSIAQYSSPFHLIGRVNEVWVDVDVSGCTSAGAAAY
ncbi:hypothetical protein SAY87_003227 [Trapa incisa]|uniref:SOUL heme-binding family protein n=1 Tax=Trapa incisa TaxID=236973 RepID=A0AAN7KIZ7_9MYRT|nr:hypothetical protein SAY87_003227 [Trapa incisa]